MSAAFPYVWFWRCRLPERKGQPCRVGVRGRMNSVLVVFPDGFHVVTGRYAVRRAPDCALHAALVAAGRRAT